MWESRRERVVYELRECGYPALAEIAATTMVDQVTDELDRLRKQGVFLIPKPSTVIRRWRGHAQA